MSDVDRSAPPELQSLEFRPGLPWYLRGPGKTCLLTPEGAAKCEQICRDRGQCVDSCSARWDPFLGQCYTHYRCLPCEDVVPGPDDLFPDGLPGGGG